MSSYSKPARGSIVEGILPGAIIVTNGVDVHAAMTMVASG